MKKYEPDWKLYADNIKKYVEQGRHVFPLDIFLYKNMQKYALLITDYLGEEYDVERAVMCLNIHKKGTRKVTVPDNEQLSFNL